MRAAQGLGQGKPRGEAGAGEPPRHVGKQRALAAEEMRHAGDVEPEPVIAVNIQRGAVAARGPAGELEKSVSVLLRRGGKGEKSGTDGARIGEAQAREETLRKAAALTAVSTSPRSSLPTRAKGRSSSNGAVPLAALSRFRRSIGRCGRKIETIRLMTELHDKTSPRRLAPAALERELPGRRAGRDCVEGDGAASPCRDAPAGEGAGQAELPMTRREAGRACGWLARQGRDGGR